MSMISNLIDELRKSADEWNGSNMFELARMCSEAADIIWQLRDDLQRANAENAKQREEFNKMDVWHSKELTAAMDENAKLRELVRDVNMAAHMLCEAWEGSCSKEAEGMSLHAVCPISDTSELCVFGKLYDRMRELGVEVDE